MADKNSLTCFVSAVPQCVWHRVPHHQLQCRHHKRGVQPQEPGQGPARWQQARRPQLRHPGMFTTLTSALRLVAWPVRMQSPAEKNSAAGFFKLRSAGTAASHCPAAHQHLLNASPLIPTCASKLSRQVFCIAGPCHRVDRHQDARHREEEHPLEEVLRPEGKQHSFFLPRDRSSVVLCVVFLRTRSVVSHMWCCKLLHLDLARNCRS